MGSLMEVNHELGEDINMDDLATKPELNNLDGSCSSSASTPEPDGEAVAQDTSQRQKRKGGRKPVGCWPSQTHDFAAFFEEFIYYLLCRHSARWLTSGILSSFVTPP